MTTPAWPTAEDVKHALLKAGVVTAFDDAAAVAILALYAPLKAYVAEVEEDRDGWKALAGEWAGHARRLTVYPDTGKVPQIECPRCGGAMVSEPNRLRERLATLTAERDRLLAEATEFKTKMREAHDRTLGITAP